MIWVDTEERQDPRKTAGRVPTPVCGEPAPGCDSGVEAAQVPSPVEQRDEMHSVGGGVWNSRGKMEYGEFS